MGFVTILNHAGIPGGISPKYLLIINSYNYEKDVQVGRSAIKSRYRPSIVLVLMSVDADI